MKQVLTILSGVILLSLASCTKQYVTPGQTNQTIYANVATTDWQSYTDNTGAKSFDVPITVNQLSGGATQFGGVVVAISYDNGTTYEQLPEVYDGLSYTYTYNAGNVTLYAQSSDGTTAIQPTLPIKVKIILVASN